MNGPYRAVVFDMDGVLADSEPVYYDAVNVVLEGLGKRMTAAQQREVMGHGVEDTWLYLIRELDLEGPIDALMDAYDRQLRRQLALVHDPLPGVRELIAGLRARRVPIAVASSSLPEWIDALLGGIGLRDAFDATVSATMVEHPKPAPDLYLLAAERLGVPPEGCIAIEDTPTGISAARSARMLAVQVRAASTAFPPLAEADLVLENLHAFDLSLLEPSQPL